MSGRLAAKTSPPFRALDRGARRRASPVNELVKTVHEQIDLHSDRGGPPC